MGVLKIFGLPLLTGMFTKWVGVVMDLRGTR